MLPRVKCKCGKLLEIPAAHAGKAMLCPSCKAPLSIPAEKPHASGVGIQLETPIAAAPPMPPPAPIELENAPTELDLSAPQGLPVDDTQAAPAVAVTTAATASYAAGGSHASRGKHPDLDVISPPAQSFWADAFDAFGYPFLGVGNAVTFAMIVFIYCLEIPLMSLRGMMSFSGFGVLLVFFIEAWIAAIYLTVVLDTAAGSVDLPGISMQDRGGACVRYLSAFACALLPATCYFILMYFKLLPRWMESSLNLGLLIAAGIFLTPLYLILFAFNATGMIYRVDLIFSTIFRTLVPYLCLWLMLLLVGFAKFLPMASFLAARAGLNVSLPTIPVPGGFLGEAFFNIVDLYLGIVVMRLIGLYYLHFKRRFTLIME